MINFKHVFCCLNDIENKNLQMIRFLTIGRNDSADKTMTTV